MPFALAVVLLMPVAYYASCRLAGINVDFLRFYVFLAAHGFVVGPPWFIWVLLFFDVALALLLMPFQRWLPAAGRWAERIGHHPILVAAGVFLLASAVYIPLLFRYGFGTWTNLLTSPFSFQICRAGLYALWFTFGFLVGVPGFAKGLLSRDGSLARHWPVWGGACILAYNALWFLPRWHLVPQPSLRAFLWVASCVASCFGFLALFRGARLPVLRWMNSLNRSAYVMYLVHYVFITWTQFFLLGLPIHPGTKFLLVFVSTTLLSWLTAQVLLRVPGLRAIL